MKSEVANKKKLKAIDPPFGYFGSKHKIAQKICSNLPPHHCWVEAFCGSASLTLCKAPAAIEVINDIDDEIVNLFTQLRKNSQELCESIALTPYAEAELSRARILDKVPLSDLERARLFLIQSMMGINGAFGAGKGGFSYSDSYSRNGKEARVNRWYNLPERLGPVVERLRNVRITHQDARKVLKRYTHRPATLLYLDPPYFTDRINGYSKEANSADFHEELLTLANRAHCMIFISGYESELYNSLLGEKNGWMSEKINTTTKGSTGQSHERTEIVWMNKYYLAAQRNGRVNIHLTAEEIKLKKLNPERVSFRLGRTSKE